MDAQTPRGSASRPNVYDVARRAGVSIATVSRVHRGNGPVASETRARVQAAMDELGWSPSVPAQALAGDNHNAVALVFPELVGRYYSEVLRGFEAEAVRRQQAVLILAAHQRKDNDAMVRDLAGRVDGMVIMDRTIADGTAADVQRRGVPVLLLARPSIEDVPAVRVAGADPTRELTTHLLDHGRRRLVFVGDPELSPDVAERWRAFGDAHAVAGLARPTSPVATGGYQQHDGREVALAVLDTDGDARPDGLVCANDQLALGAYQAAARLGLSIPDDLAVTGWDDDPFAAHMDPPLTTVNQPMYDLGACAAELLFERLDGDVVGDVTLTASFVVRSSCGCVEGASR